MTIGKIERNIVKQCLLSGEPIPDSIENAPKLEIGLELYLQAFFDLDSERDSSQDVIPVIKWSSIKNYAESFDFDEEQTESLFKHIRRMDLSHLDRINKKRKPPKK